MCDVWMCEVYGRTLRCATPSPRGLRARRRFAVRLKPPTKFVVFSPLIRHSANSSSSFRAAFSHTRLRAGEGLLVPSETAAVPRPARKRGMGEGRAELREGLVRERKRCRFRGAVKTARYRRKACLRKLERHVLTVPIVRVGGLSCGDGLNTNSPRIHPPDYFLVGTPNTFYVPSPRFAPSYDFIAD
jgi:hypothetical protein